MKIFEMKYQEESIRLDIPDWVDKYFEIDGPKSVASVCYALFYTVKDMVKNFMGDGKLSANVCGTVSGVPVSATFWRQGNEYSVSVSRGDETGGHSTIFSLESHPGFPKDLKFGSMRDAAWVMDNAGPLNAFLEDCRGDQAFVELDPRDLYRVCYSRMGGFDDKKIEFVRIWSDNDRTDVLE